MTLKIQHKRSAVAGKVPLPADLEYGEIAINYDKTDPAIYIKDNDNVVRRICGQSTGTKGKAPDVGAVTLADVAGGARFTSVAFPVSATMTDEGSPTSTKKLKAYVEGTLKSAVQSSAITNVAQGPLSNVFATTLYSGNSGTQAITNGIDLAGAGGMIWMKERSGPGFDGHTLVDTVRGKLKGLATNLIGAEDASVEPYPYISSFNSDGFTAGYNNNINYTGSNYVSWTFRKTPNFFDVVTYTGNGVAGRTVAHNLGSVPGCIIVKSTTNGSANWCVYHQSLGATKRLYLNTIQAEANSASEWASTEPTSTVFSVGTQAEVNANGETYVAYLFANDTGPGGLIRCGSYTGNASANGPVINLGWEPQWVMIKNTFDAGAWLLFDTVRGFSETSNAVLSANSNAAEFSFVHAAASSTGFQIKSADQGSVNTAGATYVYIAIRGHAQAQGTVLTLADNTQLTNFAGGDAITEVTSTGTAGDAKGTVSAVDAVAKTMTLSTAAGTWDVGSAVKGPLKASGAKAKLFCKLDAAGAVSDLQSADPGFTAWTPAGAGPYTGTVTFPATLPTGNAPDADLPAGTTVTVEVEASNTAGTDSATSNTVTPA